MPEGPNGIYIVLNNAGLIHDWLEVNLIKGGKAIRMNRVLLKSLTAGSRR